MKEEKKSRSIPGVSREAEEKQLENIIDVAQENLERTMRYNKELTEELHDMLETYGAKDKEALVLWHNTESQLQENRQDLMRCQKARRKPYFGRIDFRDSGSSKEESYYVGRVGITQTGKEPLVIDWRAPIASVYYENAIGPCSYEVKGEGTFEIDLKRKRTYEIAEDRLIDFFDSDVVANDELLMKYLGKSKKAVLGEIIGTIQKEQNAIIRKTPKKNLIVQGVAGSGKTTVAMHRISYILYNYDSFRPKDFYIIGSNRILLNYITSVLPDLDVYGVSQMTMEELFVRLLYEDWDEKVHHIRSLEQKDEFACIKGSNGWFGDLEDFCRNYESGIIPKEEIRLEKNAVLLLSKERIESYLEENPGLSMQSKINMLNEFLLSKLENEMLGKHVTYAPDEKKELEKKYRFYFGKDVWKGSIFEVYEEFLVKQREKGMDIVVEDHTYDVYDLAALAYIYKRIKETDGIREASHVIIDEAQDFGMMAYGALEYCLRGCTYTIMGDVSQNIHFGYGLNDWEDLKKLLLRNGTGNFGLLKKSYRNTVEISHFATEILRHGNFPIYPVEPIIRHGSEVTVQSCENEDVMIQKTVEKILEWEKAGHETIAVICHNQTEAAQVSQQLGSRITVCDSDLETAEFEKGVMVLPVEYTKGLEFDGVLLYHPSKQNYKATDQYVKLLYVAATRALHELAVVHMGDLTELIACPVAEEKRMQVLETKEEPKRKQITPKRKPIPELKRKPEPKPKPEPESVILNFIKREPQMNMSVHQFGDMPDGNMLRPKGHSRVDCSIRWVKKNRKYIDFATSYGVLRLTPVGNALVRVQFKRGQMADFAPDYWDCVPDTNLTWNAKKGRSYYEITQGNLIIRVDGKSSALQFLDNKGNLLLQEQAAFPRQIEMGPKVSQTWNYFDWSKDEKLLAKGILKDDLLRMNQKARYISFGGKNLRMPMLLSEKGYGLGIAAKGTVMCCDIPMYGPYVYTLGEQIDYYFMYGNKLIDF